MGKTVRRFRMHFAVHETPLGRMLAVASDRGLCALRFCDKRGGPGVGRGATGDTAFPTHHAPRTTPPDVWLRSWLPEAEFVEDPQKLRPLLQQIDDVLTGTLPAACIPLDLIGTAFQKRVWRELLKVPWGQTLSYSELARRVGEPRAVRAVASACARNPLAMIVPCHRVLRKDGSLGGYFWGLAKKKRLLDRER